MKSLLTMLILMLFQCTHHLVTAQQTEEIPMVQYSPDYVFKDGIYPNIETFMANDPIPFPRIVSDRIVYDKEFLDELLIKEEIVLYDEAGVRASIKTEDIWGCVLHGRLHIMIGNRLHRIILQGSISHFIASATTNEKVYYADEDTAKRFTTTQDLYRRFYRDEYFYRSVTAEGELCLFDIESNTLRKYDPAALGIMLERDSALFSEYKSLRNKDKKKRIAEFIRRYNSRHPLYFPAQ